MSTSTPESRLFELGIRLPVSTNPAGTYANAVRTGNLVYCSGKAPLPVEGAVPRGRLGSEFGTEEGYRFARSAAIDLLSVLKAELGELSKVVRAVELQGFVNATQDFEDHPKVLDGASDLLVEVFGDKGKHARAACGFSSLPLGAAVEIEMIVEIRD